MASADPRREYLAKHGVETAVSGAIAKVLEKQPQEPLMEVGCCLVDASHIVPAGLTMMPVLEYVKEHDVKGHVSAAIKVVAAEMPAEPILAIGRKLAAGGYAPVSDYMAYWAPSTFANSALKSEAAYNESLTMALGARCVLERAARGIVDPDVPQSEFMAYWAPRTFDASAMSNKAAFVESLKLPCGKRCMLERVARGYTELDVVSTIPRSEYLDYFAPRDFKGSALPTEKIFMESLKLPEGARTMLEREARGVVDPAVTKRSEFEEYWAPSTFAKSALKSEAAYSESLKLTIGARCVLERAARGIVDPDVPQSEFMAYWAPRTFDASAMSNKAAFAESLKLPWGERCMLERVARGKKNVAFVFAKPHANTPAVLDVIRSKFAEVGISVLSEGVVTGEEIDTKGYIDQHYYAIAEKSTLTSGKDLPVNADKFEGAFGEDWSTVVAEGRAFNALEFKAAFAQFAPEGALDKAWNETNVDNKTRVKLGGGFYCGQIEVDGKKCYTFNAFFMTMRGKFTAPGTSIHYYVVEFDSATLSWADFRGKILGPTDPKDAPAGSLRGIIAAGWEKLGLKAPCNGGDNAVHASASPFEGLAERTNWLAGALERDPFGRALLDAGVPPETIKKWSSDPQVAYDAATATETGKAKGSIFDALEDLDYQACLDKCVAISKA